MGFENAAQAAAETVIKTPLWDIHSSRHSSKKSCSIKNLESRMAQSAKKTNLSSHASQAPLDGPMPFRRLQLLSIDMESMGVRSEI